MQWLVANINEYPSMTLHWTYVSPDLFHGWRFILGMDNIVYFGNCIDARIPEEEFLLYRSNIKEDICLRQNLKELVKCIGQ